MNGLAIMQPYIFPYIGYFHLVHSSSIFVFYDDVNFIKRGWINRNNILMNCNSHRFTIPLRKASQNKLINEIETRIDQEWINNFDLTLHHAYSKAPNFSAIRELILEVFFRNHRNIGELAADSVTQTSNYLELATEFKSSSNIEHGRLLKGQERILDICKRLEAKNYINARNGIHLYSEQDFKDHQIELWFVDSEITPYKQAGCKEFVPFQSIIDVLMWNDLDKVKSLVKDYSLKRKNELV